MSVESYAVMQPYFVPYLEYFRLAKHVDTFILFDDAQFPRRGWVHRNRLPNSNGATSYLTLPIMKSPRATPINLIRFRSDAPEQYRLRLSSFFSTSEILGADPKLRELFTIEEPSLFSFVERSLRVVFDILNIKTPIQRTSEYKRRQGETAQDFIIRIGNDLGAKRYLNASGGRNLYQHQSFADAGLHLDFLKPAEETPVSILHHLVRGPLATSDLLVQLSSCRTEK